MKLFLAGTAALAAALLAGLALTLPPPRLILPPPADRTVPGMLHVHTNRSDGLSSPDDVAAAAARAGLKFLVFTDHGDGTRPPDAPVYRSGVLCLDGVEISTTAGHYIAIDMPASPYPLGGEPRDVVEDVRRLGGFGIVAHPDSPKRQLRWEDWTVPFDGVELVNLDTSWRVLAAQAGWAARRRLLAAFLDYPARAPETMARLIQPPAVLHEWEALARRRRLVTLAGADAHSRLALRNGDPGDTRLALPLPGYEASFRVMSVHVRTEQPLTGAPAADAAMLMRAIRNGHLYTAVDGIATPPSFEFTATNSFGSVREGDALAPGGPVLLHVQSNAPAGFTTIVYDGTRPLATVRDTQDHVVHAGDVPAVYWVEIVSPVGSPAVTWIRSNPIYVRGHDARNPPPAAPPVTAASRAVFDGQTATGWSAEHDARSSSAVEVARGGAVPELLSRFGLAGGRAAGQFASLVLNLPSGVEGSDAVRFTIRADRPMRLSLQFRDTTADRWQRSIYADMMSRERTIRLDDFLPVGTTHVPTAAKADIRSLMFVVDLTNTKPGTSGRFWVGDPALVTFAR